MSTDTIPDDETVGQRRLREARERAAERADDPGPTIRLPQPGEEVHCLVPGTVLYNGDVFGGGEPLRAGQVFIVTAAMIEASRDRHGQYRGVSLVHEPEMQQALYKGKILFAPGRPADDFVPWTYGDAVWAEAREIARREAHAKPTDAERRQALAEVHRKYGPAANTSWSSNTAMTTSERQAIAEDQARRTAASMGIPYVGGSSLGNGGQ
ncbi:hypothetical protein J2X55_002228 [Microbacterium sp. 1154]|uniref:hypothetical protein n=1 Tax=Microbacterium sp. 1154 TaxID=2817733 RepID=UPI002858A481|nr:hypothetical protein [Microbacterium sp. 1154]MDR6691316.1 hypothetical protein [Microbacterium sp. 1154]